MFSKYDVPDELLTIFCQKQAVTVDSGQIRTGSNTDKTSAFSCLLKWKKRGVERACTSCGLIIGIRELYGSESLTQVAQMYMDMFDHLKCNEMIL